LLKGAAAEDLGDAKQGRFRKLDDGLPGPQRTVQGTGEGSASRLEAELEGAATPTR
jgi:hypothetical protein